MKMYTFLLGKSIIIYFQEDGKKNWNTHTELHLCKHTHKSWSIAKSLELNVLISICYKTDYHPCKVPAQESMCGTGNPKRRKERVDPMAVLEQHKRQNTSMALK